MGFGRGGGSFGGDAFARSPLQDIWGVQKIAAISAGLAAITSGSGLATIMGCNAPDHLWKGDEASGSTDLVGSSNLSDVSTPTHEQLDPVFDVNGVAFDDQSDDTMEAATSTEVDISTGSLAMVVVLSGLNLTGNGMIQLKKASATNTGYVLYAIANGNLYWQTQQGGTLRQVAIGADHEAGDGVLVALGVADKNTNVQQLFSGLGTSATVAPCTDISNGAKFSIGKCIALGAKSAGMNFCMGAVWKNTNAEAASGGPTSTSRQALADYLGVA